MREIEEGVVIEKMVALPASPPIVEDRLAQQVSLGFPRDTFWPKSAAAFVGLGVILTLLAAQLVSPTRRLRLPGLRRRPRQQPIDNQPEIPATEAEA
jgi:hypothetical protein